MVTMALPEAWTRFFIWFVVLHMFLMLDECFLIHIPGKIAIIAAFVCSLATALAFDSDSILDVDATH